MSLVIRKPDDFHLHARQGDLLHCILPPSTYVFARAVMMPNTIPPVCTAENVEGYRAAIMTMAPESFTPLMTVKLVRGTTPAIIRDAFRGGAIAAKLYPEGVTTNSEDGVCDVMALFPLFATMAEIGMVLCIHGEAPGSFCLDREADFLDTIHALAREFPQFRIVVEHISTQAAAAAILEMPATVAATITAHHLILTLDDVIGGMLQPHYFCKPIAKRPEDRDALIAAATSGNPKFFFGSDSAPHLQEKKECVAGVAGIFTAPVALPVLAEVFERCGALDRLEAFTSEFGARFYGLPLNTGTIRLMRSAWRVPQEIGGVRPFRAGEMLSWQVVA